MFGITRFMRKAERVSAFVKACADVVGYARERFEQYETEHPGTPDTASTKSKKSTTVTTVDYEPSPEVSEPAAAE